MAVGGRLRAAVEETQGGFSETNTQEVGVDEGDIVETDGEYVYVANSDGLRIVSVEDADVVDEPELPRATTSCSSTATACSSITSPWTGSADTIVSLFDVSDPTDAALLRRSHLEGSVVATRSVDDVARLVITTSFDQRLPFVQPSEFGLDEDRALERNQQIIEESTVEDWLPRWFDEAGDGSFGPMAADPRLQHGRRSRRVRRPRADLDRLGRHARRRHPGRVGRHRVDRRHRVRVDRQPLHLAR